MAVEQAVKTARYNEAVRQFSVLRATEPAVSMATLLDAEHPGDDPFNTRENMEEEVERCQEPECVRLREAHRRLNCKLLSVEAALTKALHHSQQLAKAARKQKTLQSQDSPQLVLERQVDEQKEQAEQEAPNLQTSGGEVALAFGGRGPGMRDLQLPKSIVSYLEEYRRHQEGPDPAPKRQDNAFSEASRVCSFLFFLAEGKNKISTWTFLDNPVGIRSYVTQLKKVNKKPTMANFYIRNVVQFLEYFSQTSPPNCRLSKSQIIRVVRTARSTLNSMAKDELLHQFRVKSKKLDHLISKQSLRKCQELCKERIPGILEQMETDGGQPLRHTFYGYISAFICSIFGHRPGVLTNMRVSEVMRAKDQGDKSGWDGYVISVEDHKTTKDFGAAQLYLEPLEFNWILKWVKLRSKI